MMSATIKNQTGGSLLGNILLLAIFAYGVYLGIQYVPQLIESKAVDSMLDSIESQNQSQAYESGQQAEQAVSNLLNLNQMDDMMQNVDIRETSQGISIEINYERELDLLFQKKVLTTNKTLDLD